MEPSRPHLSVVIPAYNEQERLKRFVPGIVEYLRGKNIQFEIVVVNNGSRDDTAQTARDLAKHYPMLRLIDLQPNRGKGGAVKAGMIDARGDYVLFTDADQSTPISTGPARSCPFPADPRNTGSALWPVDSFSGRPVAPGSVP